MAKSGATAPTSRGGGDGGAGGGAGAAVGCCNSAAKTNVVSTTSPCLVGQQSTCVTASTPAPTDSACTLPRPTAAPAVRPSLLLSHAVARAQDVEVMTLVTGNDEGKRAHTDRLAARSTAPTPRVGVEGTEQGQRRGARGAQLAHQIGEGPRIELRDGDVGILVESGERRLVSARDPQGAISHDALDVGEMPDHFLDAPFAARVAVHRGVVGKAVEDGCRLLDLRGAHRDGIELRDPLDVADEVRRDFIGFGPSDRTGRHAGFPPSSVSAIAFTVLLSPVRMRRW